MNKGEILIHDGKKFKVQKIASDSIYASLMTSDDKCQRGKPRRLFFTELAAALGISVEQFAANLKSGQVTAKAVMKEQLSQVSVVAQAEVQETEQNDDTPEAVEEEVAEPATASAPPTASAMHDVLDSLDSENS